MEHSAARPAWLWRTYGTAAAGALATSAVFGFAAMPSASAADDFVSFNAVATGNAFNLTIANPRTIPVVPELQFAGPIAQARLSSLSDIDAFASFPYPGDAAVGVPGLLTALFGIPAPAYPAYVHTSAGDAPADSQVPGVALHAESADALAFGSATAGAPTTGNATALARTAQSQTGIAAISDAAADALNFSGVVRVSGVRSRAEYLLDSTGEAVMTTSLSIARITVPGLTLRIPDATPPQAGVPVPVPGVPQPPPADLPVLPIPSGGMTIPEPDLGFVDGTFTVTLPTPDGKPTTYAVPSEAVLDSLGASGVIARYQAPNALKDSGGKAIGIEGGSFSMMFVAPEPPAPFNQQIHGDTTFTVAFGNARAQVTGVTGAVGTNGPGLAPTTGTTPTAVGRLGIAALPTTPQGALGEIPTAPLGTAPNVAAPAAFGSHVPLSDSSNLYLLFVVGAALAFGTLQAMRLLGVRTS